MMGPFYYLALSPASIWEFYNRQYEKSRIQKQKPSRTIARDGLIEKFFAGNKNFRNGADAKLLASDVY